MVDLLSMKMKKVVSLILLAVFIFSSAGFCDIPNLSDDDGQHCVSCCGSGCHSVVLAPQIKTIDPTLTQEFIPFEAALRQELFVSGIEYPPKSFI